MMNARVSVIVLAFGLIAGSALGQTAGMLAFQARITDSLGNPVPGPVDLVFRIYDAQSGGNLVDMDGDGVIEDPGDDAQEVSGVTAVNGVVSTKFGAVAATAFDGTARWLEVTANGTTLSRLELATAPAAAEQLNIPGTGTAAVVVRFDGNVGIGTWGASEKLTVAGRVRSTSGGFVFPDDTVQVTAAPGGAGWHLTGNSGTAPGFSFLGTLDSAPLDFRVNDERALRLEPDPTANLSPNLIGGSSQNLVIDGAIGATIAGGGAVIVPPGVIRRNRISDNYGAIGGGEGNFVGSHNADPLDARWATISGGYVNQATAEGTAVGGGLNIQALAPYVAIAGGYNNSAIGSHAAVGGGEGNRGTGSHAAVGGGLNNFGTAYAAAVAGGEENRASDHAAVGGGESNTAGGAHSTVPGGKSNGALGATSFAAGHRAVALHDGAFVWADSTDADFRSSDVDQFLIRASGGVGIGTNDPGNQLSVLGDADFSGSVGIGTPSPQATLDLQTPSGEVTLNMRSGGSWTAQIKQTASSLLQFVNGDQERVTITAGGAVGIGTANPNRLLTVHADTGPTYVNLRAEGGAAELLLGAESTGGIISMMTNHKLELRTNNLARITITPAGNVGVGVPEPLEKLSAAGIIKSTAGGFMFPDGTVQTTAATSRSATLLSRVDQLQQVHNQLQERLQKLIGQFTPNTAARLAALGEENRELRDRVTALEALVKELIAPNHRAKP